MNSNLTLSYADRRLKIGSHLFFPDNHKVFSFLQAPATATDLGSNLTYAFSKPPVGYQLTPDTRIEIAIQEEGKKASLALCKTFAGCALPAFETFVIDKETDTLLFCRVANLYLVLRNANRCESLERGSRLGADHRVFPRGIRDNVEGPFAHKMGRGRKGAVSPG